MRQIKIARCLIGSGGKNLSVTPVTFLPKMHNWIQSWGKVRWSKWRASLQNSWSVFKSVQVMRGPAWRGLNGHDTKQHLFLKWIFLSNSTWSVRDGSTWMACEDEMAAECHVLSQSGRVLWWCSQGKHTKGSRGGRASGWQLTCKGFGENINCNFAILKLPQN